MLTGKDLFRLANLKKYLFKIPVLIFLIIGIIIAVILARNPQIFNKQASEGALVDLKILPEKLSVELGGNYDFKIAINPKAQRVTAASITLRYDPQAIAINKVKNEGFLPIDLKIYDDKLGILTMVFGTTIDVPADKPGMLATISFKALENLNSKIQIEPGSEVSVSSTSGNVLSVYPTIELTAQSSSQTPQDISYPNNLLLEKAFFANPSPFVQEVRDSLDPKIVIKPGRIKPAFSEAYIMQLGKDIFIEPIIALNQVIEQKAGEFINR